MSWLGRLFSMAPHQQKSGIPEFNWMNIPHENCEDEREDDPRMELSRAADMNCDRFSTERNGMKESARSLLKGGLDGDE